ncbi:hypothetical protein DFP97_108241 [Paenibacillus prosopidis]|uniref:Uncharacterized protein n=1 Tax=Paenibacillus prosopidis TaxID=630520 RepID=A0A368W4G4_9BACL|nr:hypothetical protein DFP97_108241 [Paenibacillus prosopidis]
MKPVCVGYELFGEIVSAQQLIVRCVKPESLA